MSLRMVLLASTAIHILFEYKEAFVLTYCRHASDKLSFSAFSPFNCGILNRMCVLSAEWCTPYSMGVLSMSTVSGTLTQRNADVRTSAPVGSIESPDLPGRVAAVQEGHQPPLLLLRHKALEQKLAGQLLVGCRPQSECERLAGSLGLSVVAVRLPEWG